MFALSDDAVPAPVRTILRGIGQVFFQENAWTGGCFALGIAISSPLMARRGGRGRGDRSGDGPGAEVRREGADRRDLRLQLHPGRHRHAVLLPAGGDEQFPACRRLRRGDAPDLAGAKYVPFPTYTAPFIVTTWVLFLLGKALSVSPVEPGGPLEGAGIVQAVAHGVSQVMFQASLWTGLLFLVGIALSNWEHAVWVLLGSIVGMLVGSYHATAAARVLDPESLVERGLLENVALGLYGYNATLAAVALFLWRRSLIPPLLGMLLAVLLTDLIPMLGLPALTAPFVLATWLVLAFGWLDRRLVREPAVTPS